MTKQDARTDTQIVRGLRTRSLDRQLELRVIR